MVPPVPNRPSRLRGQNSLTRVGTRIHVQLRNLHADCSFIGARDGFSYKGRREANLLLCVTLTLTVTARKRGVVFDCDMSRDVNFYFLSANSLLPIAQDSFVYCRIRIVILAFSDDFPSLCKCQPFFFVLCFCFVFLVPLPPATA